MEFIWYIYGIRIIYSWSSYNIFKELLFVFSLETKKNQSSANKLINPFQQQKVTTKFRGVFFYKDIPMGIGYTPPNPPKYSKLYIFYSFNVPISSPPGSLKCRGRRLAQCHKSDSSGWGFCKAKNLSHIPLLNQNCLQGRKKNAQVGRKNI